MARLPDHPTFPHHHHSNKSSLFLLSYRKSKFRSPHKYAAVCTASFAGSLVSNEERHLQLARTNPRVKKL
jgi:hypothetical protein